MQNNSEVIKEAPEPTKEARFDDDGVTDDKAQLFPDLLDRIEKMPDRARRLNQAYAAVKRIAEAPAASDQVATADEAAERLACAFATVHELVEFIPADTYNAIAGALDTFIEDIEWQSDPRLLRLILPHLLKSAIEREQLEREIEV